jgi:hypothetical protein
MNTKGLVLSKATQDSREKTTFLATDETIDKCQMRYDRRFRRRAGRRRRVALHSRTPANIGGSTVSENGVKDKSEPTFLGMVEQD